MSAQNHKNHSRWDPVFHFFIMPALLINIIVVGCWYGKNHEAHARIGPWAIVMSVVLFMAVLKIRAYATKLQDRIIRLEERVRLSSLLNAGELAEVDSLTTRQLIALRFASNPELPELARRAVRENLTSKQIKESIKSWRADEERV